MKSSYNLNIPLASEVKEIHDNIIQRYIDFVKNKSYFIMNPVGINS